MPGLIVSRSGIYQARFTELGDATVTGRGASPIAVMVVPAAEVAAIEVAVAGASVAFGGHTTAAVKGYDADGNPLFGLADDTVMTTSTPTVCELAPNAAAGDDAFTVSVIGHGTCTVDASIGGTTASADLAIP